MTTSTNGRQFDEQRMRTDRAYLRDWFDGFFGSNCRPYRVLRRMAAWLDATGLPYAITGELAVTEHGYRKSEPIIELILRPGDVATFCRTFADLEVDAARSRDGLIVGQACGVRVRLHTAELRNVPDPAASEVFDGIRVLTLPALVGFLLASKSPARHYKVAAEVLGLIDANGLSDGFAAKLPPAVRPAFLRLHRVSVECVDPHVEVPPLAPRR